MKKLLIVVIAAVLLPGAADAAAPDTSLKVSSIQRGAALRFTFRPSSTAEGCLYELYAGATTGKLARALSSGEPIVALTGRSAARAITAATLPRIRSRDRAVSYYFGSKTICGDDTALSKRIKVNLPSASSGSAVSASNFQKNLRAKLLLAAFTFREVFSTLDLSSPLDLQPARDGTGRIFIVEQGGRILAVTPNGTSATATEFLQISSKLSTGGERGLLGMAVHPNFAQNGYFYLNYTRHNGDTIISRFTRDAGDPTKADPNSEFQLLHVVQPFSNHNGGGLAFGKDGFLYIGLGDGGSGGDPFEYGQDRTTLLGKFLRIDVDSTSNGNNYAIPADNPFVGAGSGIREEIFAYGVRNPFRFSFDAVSGLLWAGDVGQGEREEVDIIQSGANYGWNIMEGTACYEPATNCNRTGLTLPVTEYTHAVGQSITGGYVYRGSEVPALRGQYIYGDFVSGRLFTLNAGRRTENPLDIADTAINISGFGQDGNNELYIVAYEGAIYKFVER